MKINRIIPYICTGLIVVVMVFCSEALHEHEIIFPEIAALSVGYLVAPKRSWRVNGWRMFLLIALCATLGVLVVRYVPLSTLPEIVIAFSFAQILFMYSGTTFAPFVSAIVLPIMLRTTTWVYPVAAMVLTLIIILLHNLFLQMGVIEDEEYVPVKLNHRYDWIDTIIRIEAVYVLGLFAFSLNMKYIIAPPLLVAFTEFSRPRNKARNKPAKAIAFLTGCAVVGAACRWIVNIYLGFSLTAAACVTIIILLHIVHITKMYMPPAGAITILSILIPAEAVTFFPVQILIGSCFIMFISRVLFKYRQEKYGHFVDDHELKME